MGLHLSLLLLVRLLVDLSLPLLPRHDLGLELLREGQFVLQLRGLVDLLQGNRRNA